MKLYRLCNSCAYFTHKTYIFSIHLKSSNDIYKIMDSVDYSIRIQGACETKKDESVTFSLYKYVFSIFIQETNNLISV